MAQALSKLDFTYSGAKRVEYSTVWCTWDMVWSF